MEARLTGLNKNEALIYLGYKGGEVPPEIDRELDRCAELLMKTAKPRLVYRRFEILPDGGFLGTEFMPQGENVRELLRDCCEVIVFGATLGNEVEALIRRAQIKDMAKAVMLDSCASCAIENVCDNFCADMQAEVSPRFLTDRFSPGFGDLPFEQQKDFFAVLDMSRRIGVSLSPGGLMIPQKSVTALMGIAETPQKKRFRGCAYCSRFKNCSFRKGNKSCGKG